MDKTKKQFDLRIASVFCFCCLMLANTAFSQSEKAVQWLNFEQLYDSLQTNPKKVFVDFYADWCGPCIRMQKKVFTDKKIVDLLNDDYYAVKMNVESTDTIRFGDQVFTNKRQNRVNPIHQIPLLMASQKNQPLRCLPWFYLTRILELPQGISNI